MLNGPVGLDGQLAHLHVVVVSLQEAVYARIAELEALVKVQLMNPENAMKR